MIGKPELRLPADLWKRSLVIVVFVSCWMALGWILKLDANEYLLLGLPLTALFQLFVHRRPIRALWVRNGPRLRLSPTWFVLTVALAAYPVYELLSRGLHGGWVIICWFLCAILGAPASAYSLQHVNNRVAQAVWPALAGFVVFASLMVLVALSRFGWAAFHAMAGWEVIRSTLLYFPVCFFLEEVTFRGALDAYLYRPGEQRGMLSAMGLSFLWGLWHLPIVPLQDGLLVMALRLGLLHMGVGLPLALSWRIGGNLSVPAAAHAMLDGVRNALQLMK
jgi:Type II CAAX prenyl endopeptidase Rce1-like